MGTWFNLFTNKNNFFIDGNILRLDVTKPQNYDFDLPDIQSSEFFEKMTFASIYDYFVDFVSCNINLTSINGKTVAGDMSKYTCDYCKTAENILLKFCVVCNKYMCKLCFEEKTEEEAKQNGAKKWEQRKDAILHCFSHLDKLIYNDNLTVKCDGCGIFSLDLSGVWKQNRDDDMDFCPLCVPKGIFSSDKWCDIQRISESFRPCFGSLLDWIPILKKKDDMIFYNINKQSPHYHKIMLNCVDTYNKHEFFVCSSTLQEIVNSCTRMDIKEYLESIK